MDFNPGNNIVKLCLQGMAMEAKNDQKEAGRLFLQAWNEASNDFEKYIAAFYVSRHQDTIPDKLKWLETTLKLALTINDDSVKAVFPLLYSEIAKSYSDLKDKQNAEKNYALAASFKDTPTDKGPFYHGTKADLKIGDRLTAGGESNYKTELIMNHIYFTALVHGAALAAELAKGNGAPRVYIVEPTGDFENDPNVTNKKFPGNPTRSYRSQHSLKIVGEVKEWPRLSPGELQNWRNKLENNKGEIIN